MSEESEKFIKTIKLFFEAASAFFMCPFKSVVPLYYTYLHMFNYIHVFIALELAVSTVFKGSHY